jgi:hypothetical protein
LANLDKLIVLNLIEVPKALDRISDPARRGQVLTALKSELRSALEGGKRELDKMQRQLDEAQENHQAALEAVQKQEMELIKLRQKDAPAAELATASSVLEPLKEALNRLSNQKQELQTTVAPFRGVVEALSDKLMVLSGYDISTPPKPEQPESRSEARAHEPKATAKEAKETHREAPKDGKKTPEPAKTGESRTAPKAPVYPAGSYNPFKMVDYIVGKIEAEELLAGIDENELKAYLAQKELDQLEEEADIAKRLNELKKKLSNG